MYGMSRKLCDHVFLKGMNSICSALRRKRWFLAKHIAKGLKSLKRFSCKGGAKSYYVAVRTFGADHFAKKSPGWCEDACVKQFLSRNFNLMA